MIKAKHHSVIYPFFRWLARYILKRRFDSLHITGDFEDNGCSVLIVANHISWWDGFWVEYLNRKIIQRRMYFMMQEEQLKKHWYFRYTGGFSVRRCSKEVLKGIAYMNKLLEDKANMVLMFPQGKICSIYNSQIKFERGVNRIVSNCANDTQVLFVINLPEYFSNVRPHVFVYIKAYTAGYLRNGNLEEQYNIFYNHILGQHKMRTS